MSDSEDYFDDPNVKAIKVADAGGDVLQDMVDIDGFRVNSWDVPRRQLADTVRGIPNLRLRDDDILIFSLPKSGCNWLFEIISMLVNDNAETIPATKIDTMFINSNQEKLDKVASPRLLNTHFPPSWLPMKELKEKQIKIVWILRNPKDAAVSYFYHHRGVKSHQYTGKFEHYLPLFVTGQLEFGGWFDVTLEMEKVYHTGEYNIYTLFYEDLKLNGLEEIRKLANFLGTGQNEDLFQAIHDKCQFENMRVDKAAPDTVYQQFCTEGFRFFRKGVIGDWKNHFTVAMSEDFDRIYKEKMKDSKLAFKYSPDDK